MRSVEHRTCDLGYRRLDTAGQLLHTNFGQVNHTHVPLSPSSVTGTGLTPLTYTPEIGAITPPPDFKRQFFMADAQLLTSLTAFGSQRQSMLEAVHWHEKLALESGGEFRRMTPISGTGFWNVCQGPKGGDALWLGR